MSNPYYQQDGITIYHGDCREILPTLTPESITLLWTDPPYGNSNQEGHDLQASLLGRQKQSRGTRVIASDRPEEMRMVVDAALSLSVPLLRRDRCCCCCCCCGGGGPSPTFAWVAQRMDTNGLSFFHACIWDKRGGLPGLGWKFRRDYEMIMVAHRSGGKLAWVSERALSNILSVRRVRNDHHPTTKPTALPGFFIDHCTTKDDLVLDPFMGSGTTLVAAKDMGRRAIGIELEERYCEVAARRLSQGVMELE